MLVMIHQRQVDTDKVYIVPFMVRSKVIFKVCRPSVNFQDSSLGKWAEETEGQFRSFDEAEKWYRNYQRLEQIFKELEPKEL